MRLRSFVLLFAVFAPAGFLAGFSDAARAAGPDARGLIEAAKAHRNRGERRIVNMDIVAASGKVGRRSLVVQTFFGPGDDRTLIRFVEPRDVARLGLLTVQRSGEDDEQHLYLPSQKKAKRIAASDRTGLFAGTDFAYEDLRAEDLDRHEYRLAGEEASAGDRSEPCWRIEATPRADEAEESGYGRRELIVAKARPCVVESRHYAKEGGALVKVIRCGDWRKVGAFERPHRVEVDNRARGGKTVAVAKEWVADEKLGPDAFTVFELERGK